MKCFICKREIKFPDESFDSLIATTGFIEFVHTKHRGVTGEVGRQKELCHKEG